MQSQGRDRGKTAVETPWKEDKHCDSIWRVWNCIKSMDTTQDSERQEPQHKHLRVRRDQTAATQATGDMAAGRAWCESDLEPCG